MVSLSLPQLERYKNHGRSYFMCGLPCFPVADHTIMMNFIEIQYLNKCF